MFSGRRPGVMNIPARDQTTPARALLLLGPRGQGAGWMEGRGGVWGTAAEPGPDQLHWGGRGCGRGRMREATTVAGSGFDDGT